MKAFLNLLDYVLGPRLTVNDQSFLFNISVNYKKFVFIISIFFFREDNAFSMLASLPYGPPVNTDIDYFQTFCRTFYFL